MFTRVNRYKWTRAVQSKVLEKEGYREFHLIVKDPDKSKWEFSVYCEGGTKLIKITQNAPSYAEAVKIAADWEANAESEKVFTRFWSRVLVTVAVVVFAVTLISAF